MDLDDSLMRAATEWMIEDGGVTPACTRTSIADRKDRLSRKTFRC